jgi:hypothetical protein
MPQKLNDKILYSSSEFSTLAVSRHSDMHSIQSNDLAFRGKVPTLTKHCSAFR